MFCVPLGRKQTYKDKNPTILFDTKNGHNFIVTVFTSV
jgi:hypothetical protein